MAKADIQQTKVCTKCGSAAPLSFFYRHRRTRDGHTEQCKQCIKEQQRQYRQANALVIAKRDSERKKRSRQNDPEKFRERSRAWNSANPEKLKAKTARWMEANAERKRATNKAWKIRNADKAREQNKAWWSANKDKAREYARKRRLTPQGKINASVRSGIYGRLSRATGRKGKAKTFELLGYTVEALVIHLERQFLNGMNWDNYGQWHVDHIVPLSSFSYETFQEPDFRAAWALTNLRPMWGGENIAKGAKRLTLL